MENPQALSAYLPTKWHVEAFSKASEAKEQLPHGQFLPAMEALGFSMQDSHRLRQWYEACESPDSGPLDPYQAEQKLSRHAREEFCRAAPEVKALVVQDIARPEVGKITAADLNQIEKTRSQLTVTH